MNKLPAKQIYLLSIIVFGIITLSIYSTYSIFTFDSQTSNIVSINTPNNLSLLTSTNEYKQINIPRNSYVTTDIDIYNNYDYPLCYSIWYKVEEEKSNSKIKIYENTSDLKEASGVIDEYTNRRVNLIIINDSDNDEAIKIGLSYSKDADTCSLNLSSDLSTVTYTLDNPKELSSSIINATKDNNHDANYLTYKNIETNIKLSSASNIYVSEKFDYANELFTLNNPTSIKPEDLSNYISNNSNNYYICLYKDNCEVMYRVIATEEKNENDKSEFYLTKYDKLIGYMSGNSGLRKIDNDYIYYGDNPHNFIYYNCANLEDTNTCELWRIVGFTYDTTNNKYITKLVRNDSLGLYDYSIDNQKWNKSNIYKYLNNEYKLLNQEFIKEIEYKQSYISSMDNSLKDILYFNDNLKSKVNILSLKDYLNASICEKSSINDYNNNECLKNNWLNNIEISSSWTMTAKYEEPTTDSETGENIPKDNNTIYTIGDNISDNIVSDKLNIRPVVYLNSRVFLIDGDGSLDNPYVIR